MAVYVIAGASSGIGQAIAKQLAKHQENSLILLGRTFQQHATQENNKNTKQIIADLSCIRGIKEAVQKIKKEVGERKVEYIIQSQGTEFKAWKSADACLLNLNHRIYPQWNI